ncbi:MAG: hypothetical protein MJ237_02525 [bacterium]|nr:hypothetical protein [bacterium]
MNIKTPLIIEQHFHGAFGIDFNTADTNEILILADKLLKYGIGGFFPTLVTDSVDNIKRQINVIKKASELCNRILGIHLEGIFINPEKKGIHNPEYFMSLTKNNYKLIEDNFIKIITLAPELDEGLIEYLKNKNIKIQAGHCVGEDLNNVCGTTHTFNAMSGISHKSNSTSLSALTDDRLYSEIIADGIHVCDKALKLFFKSKPDNKVILVSDSLPITHSEIKETTFAGYKIFYDGARATSSDNTLAGSTVLLPEIIQRLGKIGMFNPQFINNVYEYHSITPNGEIEWDENWNIKKIQYEGHEIL